MIQTPEEIQILIFQHVDTSIESLTTLTQTCTSLKRLLDSVDATVIKHKVQQRVPWMEIQQPGTGLDTWMDAARRIVTQRRQFEQHDSIDLEHYGKDILRNCGSGNTDINYIDAIEVDGKMVPGGKNLPTSFSPMFQEEFPTPCGGLRGKYMEEVDKGFIDLTTMEYQKEEPYPPKTTWTGCVDGDRLPMSGIRVVNTAGHGFSLLQETERWVLVHIYKPDIPDEITKFLLDKNNVVVENNQSLLYFDTNTRAGCTRTYAFSQCTFVHLLPGSTGAIVFEPGEGDETVISYDSLTSQAPVVLITANLNSSDFGNTCYTEQTYRGVARQLVVTYGGILYLHIKEKLLSPLWIDLCDGKAFGGVRKGMKSILLTPQAAPPSIHKSFGMVRSENGRWAMQTLSAGRIVVDLSTQKTYIIRTKSKWPNPGFVFVGLNEDVPVFYICHMAYGIKMDDGDWEDLDESFGKVTNIKDTGSYLKYRDPNEILDGSEERLKTPRMARMVVPSTRDQNERSVEWQLVG